MPTPLERIGLRQSVWSRTADTLKTRYGIVRTVTFSFTILGAVLATVASQLQAGEVRSYSAIASSVFITLGALLAARFLGHNRVIEWVRSRSAAEALKREAYKHAAMAAPYDGTDRDAKLHDERGRIENDIADLEPLALDEAGPGRGPQVDLGPAKYIDERPIKQIKFYNDRAGTAKRRASLFRGTEFVLALTTAIITGVVSQDKNFFDVTFQGMPIDFAALAAVLTTISGTILAHVEAQRYDHTVAQYRAAARRLRTALDQVDGVKFTVPSNDWSEFVARCEAILAEENSSWIATWSKPTA